jgi:ABC-type branched-subunit amino acid transport system ATPase component
MKRADPARLSDHARRGPAARDRAGLRGELACLRRAQGLASAGSGRLRCRPLQGRPTDVMAWVRTFQLPSMPRRMTVTQVLRGAAAEGAGLASLFRPASNDNADVDRLLGELSLSPVQDLSAASLSGGQKKLLSIAIALRTRPRMICLDEPTAGVHPNLRSHIVTLLKQVNAAGVTLLVVEHDMHSIRELCGR